jgi:hypothetical protein
LTVHFGRQFIRCQVSDAEPGEDQVSYRTVSLSFSQAFDAEPGEDQVSYRSVTLSFSQAFDAEPGEDQVPYRAVTIIFRVSGFSMPSLVKTRSRIGP